MLWNRLLSFLLDKDNHRFILLAVVVLLVVSITTLSAKLRKTEYLLDSERDNIEVLGDSLKTYLTEYGSVINEKKLLQTSVDRLELYSGELKDELDELKATKPKVIVKTVIETVYDTTYLYPEYLYANNYHKLSFSHVDSSDGYTAILRGFTKFKLDTVEYKPFDYSTVITDNKTIFDLSATVEDVNGIPTIKLKTPNNSIIIRNLNGAILSKSSLNEFREKRWGLGLSSGLSFTGSKFTPYIGIGFNYNLIRF